MPIQVEALKEMAIKGLEAKFGEGQGKALGFLFFGGWGVPGIVDGATLAAKANDVDEAGEAFTEDMAVGLATDAAKAGV